MVENNVVTDVPIGSMIAQLAESRTTLVRFMLGYESAIDEVRTKLAILSREFEQAHQYNPIEHISSRLKTPQSLIAKARKRGCRPDVESIRAEILDIAGVRVVCTYVSDVYRLQELVCSQSDVRLLDLKDYIANPKPSGYRSLHAIISIPVYLSTETVHVPVEIQFRTIAQEFWASLEHKIFYKYDKAVPDHLTTELRRAAGTAAELDATMERLAAEIDSQDPNGHHTVTQHDVQTFLDFLRG